ncbi:MAG: hypothetical protein R3282_04825, partial [Rhodothermales bacterium]|nr:hypothetical protein [Rhodothermales bacterium]
DAIRSSNRKGNGPDRYGWLSRKFIDSVSPGSRSVKTASAMRPDAAGGGSSSLDKDETLSEFVRLTNRYIGVIRLSEGVDIGRTKLRSPFLWLLRLPIGAFMDALGQHALRHVGQAERVTKEVEFPR